MQSLEYGSEMFSIFAEENYIEERQAIAIPFTDRSYPSRHKPSPFTKRPKATPMKRRNPVTTTKPHNDKLCKPKKVNVGYHPGFAQLKWLAIVNTNDVEAVSQAPIPYQQTAALTMPTQPA